MLWRVTSTSIASDCAASESPVGRIAASLEISCGESITTSRGRFIRTYCEFQKYAIQSTSSTCCNKINEIIIIIIK